MLLAGSDSEDTETHIIVSDIPSFTASSSVQTYKVQVLLGLVFVLIGKGISISGLDAVIPFHCNFSQSSKKKLASMQENSLFSGRKSLYNTVIFNSII